MTQSSESGSVSGSVQHINPNGLSTNPAFTQVVSVTGPVKTIYVGGQNAVNERGEIIGKGDLALQTQQTLSNLRVAVTAAGGELEQIIKWNVYVLQGQSMQAGFAAFQQFWGQRPNPPVISGHFVAGLAHPDFLVEIDAIAVVPLA